MSERAAAAAFAARVRARHGWPAAARHRHARAAPPVLHRVLRRWRRPIHSPFPAIRLAVHLARRIRLERVSPASRRPLAQPASPLAMWQQALRLAERLLARAYRHDIGDAQPGAADARASKRSRRPRVPDNGSGHVVSAPLPSVPRIVRRMPEPAPELSAAHNANGVASTPARRAAHLIRAGERDRHAPEAALSRAELDRVTSHVVQTLDRRLSAWRERTGRI